MTLRLKILLVLVTVLGHPSLYGNASEIGDAIYLWPKHTAGECPSGKAVPQDRCESAVSALVPDDYIPFTGGMSVGSWSHTPCGCVLWKDTDGNFRALFDTGGNTCSAIGDSSTESYLLCTEQPPGGGLNSIFIWPTGLKERCPHGSEVSQERCLASTRALVNHDFINWNDADMGGVLEVSNWSYTPCGCHIWTQYQQNKVLLLFNLGEQGCSKDEIIDGEKRYDGQIVCNAPPPCFLLCEA